MIRDLKGFTLIELLVAFSIFSVIAVTIYSSFHTGVFAYRKIEDNLKIYQGSRIVLDRMALELRNSFPYKEKESGFIGKPDKLSFFSLIATKGSSIPSICKVDYSYRTQDNEKLLERMCRKGVEGLKEETESEIEPQTWLVEEVNFSYLYSKEEEPFYQWEDFWETEEVKKKIPKAVKIQLKLSGAKKTDSYPLLSKIVEIPLGEEVSLDELAGVGE